MASIVIVSGLELCDVSLSEWGRADGDHYLDHSPKDSGNPLIEKQSRLQTVSLPSITVIQGRPDL